ncbi:unnamed protein product [Caenorhabditis angaria]|uniref:7TM GPCR serpentine receptor class x (Srx) domain-containing protein n=1 Tax=Caenorhabditis angaria TaxID=860376 RepID=A0A9P1J111_9PELO|nr:unnamed protein product [Caenorhabditis angaria]
MFADIVYESGDEYIQNSDDIKAACLVIIPCLIGFIMAIIALRGCYVIPSMNSSFGYLMRYQLISLLIAPLNSAVFYLFGVVFDIKYIIYKSRSFGLISTTLIPMILSQYLMISINRLFALVTPVHYSKIYDPKLRRIYVFACWIIPIVYTVSFTSYYDCGYKFYHYGWVFSFVISDTCGTKFEVLLRGVQGILANTIFIIDIITMFLLVCFGNRVFKNKSAQVRKREINFGQQVIIQGFVFMIHGLWYSLAYKLFPQSIPENWRIFWTTSFSASLLHVFGTAVIFIFNNEFSKWLRGDKTSWIISTSTVTAIKK